MARGNALSVSLFAPGAACIASKRAVLAVGRWIAENARKAKLIAAKFAPLVTAVGVLPSRSLRARRVPNEPPALPHRGRRGLLGFHVRREHRGRHDRGFPGAP